MNPKLKQFYEREPEMVIEWQDNYTPAHAWLVINSLTNGAAGGGTRMREGCNQAEVTELAKTMEIKFTVSGPPIGGAKTGIDYNFKDTEDKQAVLGRWYKHIIKELKSHYGTGGDENVDQIRDVFPILSSLGINHPQEGVVRGYLHNYDKAVQDNVINNLSRGTQMPIQSDSFLNQLRFTVSDIATGYGISNAVKSFLDLSGENIQNQRVVLQGFGNVGRGAIYLLNKIGAKIVGVVDRDWYVVDEQGLDIPDLMRQSFSGTLASNKKIKKDMGRFEFPKFDIFIPAATSHTIDKYILNLLIASGVNLIASGANNAFVNSVVADQADRNISVIPDFIANAGMARVYSYLMSPKAIVNEGAILQDIQSCVSNAVKEVFAEGNEQIKFTDRAEEIAASKLLGYD